MTCSPRTGDMQGRRLNWDQGCRSTQTGTNETQHKGIAYGDPIIETNSPIGKRKAQAKKAEASGAPTGTLIKSEALVECWDIEQQSFNLVFPLCPDHLITLLQFNALRALAVNRTLISGILLTPLDCDEEIIHVIPYPTKPELLPLALLPTTLQQTVPHGDWIDLFQCPEGRDRLIQAAGAFDEDELWADCIGGLYEGFPDDEVERRGIITWSAPWDITGWEMSEGFLEKWGWLFKGLLGPIEATNR
ncbi:hypothetical protein MMC18_001323 [Xylographa bjoerkii]|nr:hypothetical protein [Xylographa bjoerkii]